MQKSTEANYKKPNHMHKSHRLLATSLERWVSIRQQLLKESLEPRPGLWGRLKSIGQAAMRIVSGSSRVGRPVALSARLDPDKCVFQSVSCVGGWADSEACTNHVAPVSPGVLGGWLNTVAGCMLLAFASGRKRVLTSVGDEVSWEASGGE